MTKGVLKYNLSEDKKKWFEVDTKEGVEEYMNSGEYWHFSTVIDLLGMRGEKQKAEKMIKESGYDNGTKATLMQTLYFDVLDDED